MLQTGHRSYAVKEKVMAMVPYDTAPVRRQVQNGNETGMVIDATKGKKTKTVIFLSNGMLVLSAIEIDTLAKRFKEVES